MTKWKPIAPDAKKGPKAKQDPPRKKAKGLVIKEGRQASTPVVSHPPGKAKSKVGEPPESSSNDESIQFTSTESDSEDSGGSKTPVHTPTPATTTRLAASARRAFEGRSKAVHDPMPSTSNIVPAPPAPLQLARHANRLKVAGLRTILEEKILSIEGVR